jgi:hypothetical protein
VIAIAGLQIVTGGAEAPPALHPHSTPRTTADGLQGMEDGHAQTA